MTWITWALLSAFFAGVTAVLAKVGVEDVNSNLATAVRTAIVLIFTWAIALAVAPKGALGALSRHAWLFLTLSGIATGLSWLCYFRALQLGPVSRVAPIDKLSVVFAIVLGVLVFRERLAWPQIAGGGFIVVGAILLAWK